MDKELRKNLFIIGNGFDIAHGIPSKYTDFQKFIRSLYMTKELIDKSYDSFSLWRYSVPRTNSPLGHYYENQDYTIINILGFLDYCISRSQNPDVPYNFYINSDWWSVEETLGNLDLKEFFLDKSDEIFEEHYDDKEWLLYDVAECFKYLEKLAALWASQIEVSNVQPIKDFSKLINSDRLLKINNDLFITFNYTPTLEVVYGVKEVVHVHGVAGRRVMLGHNPDIDVDHFCVHNSIPEYCKHAAQVLLNVTSKDTEKNVLRLLEIITQKCAGITDIYSYGFSFAYVDLPYITLVCSTIDTKNVVWHLLDFDPLNRRNHYIDVIKQCGFKGRFSTYHIKTSMIKQEKSNPYKKHINSKKEYLGKGRYLFEQIVLRYYTVNYTPTRLDVLLFIPRIVRCGFWLLIDSIKRK